MGSPSAADQALATAEGAVPAPGASAGHSRFVQRVRRRYGAELGLLPPGLPDATAIRALVDHLQPRHGLAAALRIARQLVLERLAVLDVEAGAAWNTRPPTRASVPRQRR